MKQRDIEIFNDENRESTKTQNKSVMGHAIEHAEAVKGGAGLLRKTHFVRNHIDVMLPYELVGSNGRQLTLCGRETEEHSSIAWKDMKNNDNKLNKRSKRAWKDFMQWLRYKNIETLKDFKGECEWKWLVNKEKEIFCTKRSDNMHNKYKKWSKLWAQHL